MRKAIILLLLVLLSTIAFAQEGDNTDITVQENGEDVGPEDQASTQVTINIVDEEPASLEQVSEEKNKLNMRLAGIALFIMVVIGAIIWNRYSKKKEEEEQ